MANYKLYNPMNPSTFSAIFQGDAMHVFYFYSPVSEELSASRPKRGLFGV